MDGWWKKKKREPTTPQIRGVAWIIWEMGRRVGLDWRGPKNVSSIL